MRREPSYKRTKYRVRELADALHKEKQVSLELSRALQVQLYINNTLRDKLEAGKEVQENG